MAATRDAGEAVPRSKRVELSVRDHEDKVVQGEDKQTVFVVLALHIHGDHDADDALRKL